MTEKRNCYFCKGNEPKQEFIGKCWVIENQYLGPYGRILKECLVGGAERSEKDRTPIKTIYYCSLFCMEEQAEEDEKELWKKGDCKKCHKPLAVINDDCKDKKHKRLGCLMSIKNTPDCLKHKK